MLMAWNAQEANRLFCWVVQYTHNVQAHCLSTVEGSPVCFIIIWAMICYVLINDCFLMWELEEVLCTGACSQKNNPSGISFFFFLTKILASAVYYRNGYDTDKIELLVLQACWYCGSDVLLVGVCLGFSQPLPGKKYKTNGVVTWSATCEWGHWKLFNIESCWTLLSFRNNNPDKAGGSSSF